MSNLMSYLPDAKGYPNVGDFVYNINNILHLWGKSYGAVWGVEQKWCGVDLNTRNVSEFIKDFCLAYGGRGKHIKDDVINNNIPKKLAYYLNQARDSAYASNPVSGIQIIKTNINYLGWSYGSKALRVLCPENAIAFDEEMSKKTQYPQNITSYAQYLKDCRNLQYIIQQKTKIYRRVSDVEAALFQYLVK